MAPQLFFVSAKTNAATDAGAGEVWREGLAPYHLERVLGRITRFCDNTMWYGLDDEPRESLLALAAFIDQLHGYLV